MDLDKIKALIDLLAQSPLAKLEVVEGAERVKLVKTKRRSSRGTAAVVAEEEASAASDMSVAQLHDSGESSVISVAGPLTSDGRGHIVTAPMFGLAHLTPSPDAAPFVEIGDTVTEGQVLCTIEAMKMFNAVEATHEGAIAEIFVTPGAEVDAGQPLFRIG